MDNWEVEAEIVRRRRRNEEEERLRENAMRRNVLRQLRDIADPFASRDNLFMGIYRLSKDMVRALVEEIRPHCPAPTRAVTIPLEMKVLCALHFYGQGSYQKSAGSDSNLGMRQGSVSRAIQEVTQALNNRNIVRKWMEFPLNRNDVQSVIQRNSRVCEIPEVLGFVDGTHVMIKTPAENEHLYLNRKARHSLNCQLFCDADMVVLNVLARYPGSNHDSYVWANSAVRERMVEMWAANEKCWLLGDSGYPHEPWLQTPILNAVPGSPEARYTSIHVRARSTVERCIGTLKGRFRCVHGYRVLEYDPQKAGCIFRACCVLHNMCMKARLPPVVDVEVEECHDADERGDEGAEVPVGPPARLRLQEARAVREEIIRHLR